MKQYWLCKNNSSFVDERKETENAALPEDLGAMVLFFVKNRDNFVKNDDFWDLPKTLRKVENVYHNHWKIGEYIFCGNYHWLGNTKRLAKVSELEFIVISQVGYFDFSGNAQKSIEVEFRNSWNWC